MYSRKLTILGSIALWGVLNGLISLAPADPPSTTVNVSQKAAADQLIKVRHRTVYRYDHLVDLSPQEIRLRPASSNPLTITEYQVNVLPKPVTLRYQADADGNPIIKVWFDHPTGEFVVEVSFVVHSHQINPFDFVLDPDVEKFPIHYNENLERRLKPFLTPLPEQKRFTAFLAKIRPKDSRTIDWLVSLNKAVFSQLKYNQRFDPGVLAPEELLERGTGTCRDFAWLLVQALRSNGLAARFVSGYLVTPGSGPKVEFAFHAWVEVYLPGAGWVGLDPTCGLFCAECYIPLCCTAEPSDASAISGMFRAAMGVTENVKSEMSVEMEAVRVP